MLGWFVTGGLVAHGFVSSELVTDGFTSSELATDGLASGGFVPWVIVVELFMPGGHIVMRFVSEDDDAQAGS